jgi:hypothetical protein
MIRRSWRLLACGLLVLTACSRYLSATPVTEMAVTLPVTQIVITVIASPTASELLAESITVLPPTFTPAPPVVPLTPSTTLMTPTAKIALTETDVTFVASSSTATLFPTSTPSPTGAGIVSGSTLTPILVTPTAVPPTVATPSLPPPVVGASSPRIYETTITIPTYGYEAGFQPTEPGNPIYPYPELDFDLVLPPSMRTYRAVVLENGFVSITILPELGGRIYRWVDKATGRRLLYENPVIKPTHWGYKGWWLAAGGIEWAFPVDEHGLNEWRPWSYHTGSTAHGLSVTVSNVEDRTGMEVGATISLGTGHAYLVIQPWARNNTGESHPYQLWLNAMLAFNNNTVSGQTQFIVPAGQVTVHSTDDGALSGAGSTISWPHYAGRDLSWYNNWNGWLGFVR